MPALKGTQPAGQPSGNELREQCVQTVDGLRPGADQIVAVADLRTAGEVSRVPWSYVRLREFRITCVAF